MSKATARGATHRHVSQELGLLERSRQIQDQKLERVGAQDGNRTKVVLNHGISNVA